ncbi:MAG: methionyl-tRNA formyltransferase [Acetobacteraceae bacterium]|nr:methionyl-tRNA formyltransferase [Acetobacteraceae bacterium]
MRVAIIGQQAFGKAVLDAFMARGDTVAAVFCAPEKGRPDPLRVAGEEAGVPTYMFPKLTSPDALEALREAKADIGIMAYVTQFVSQEFCAIPVHGTIQFHPSLLPIHRGASAMSWSIILGRNETGFTIFRPSDGLDEGPVIFTRAVRIEPDDTLGSLYFGKVFPAGVAGLLEGADLVLAGKGEATEQVEDGATYEGIIGAAESEIHWASHVDLTYNLIRGCDPAPGAWTTYEGKRLYLFEVEKRPARTFSKVKGKKMGQLVSLDTTGAVIQAPGGAIVAKRLRFEDGKKVAAEESGLLVGTILGR